MKTLLPASIRSALGSTKRKVLQTLSGGRPSLNPLKLQAIDYLWQQFQPRSFADLGGVWGVDGGYTFHAMGKPGVERGCLVDTDFTPAVERKRRRFPKLELIHGNFGDPAIPARLGGVEVVFLFDVLLHQVKPNWDEILAMYAPVTQAYLIFNQQWIGSERTVRLLDLGEERYFESIPPWEKGGPYDNLFSRLNEFHPQHNRLYRDIHNIWQWGIVDADLMGVMDRLGFRLQLFKNCGQYCGQFGKLKDFENHLFLYTRKTSAS